MPTCPRCHSTIDSTVVRCPHCYNELKAFGHPGITLHRAEKGTYLCRTCVYDKDDSCTYPQRPYADTCTLYENYEKPVEIIAPVPLTKKIQNWCRRNQTLLIILIMLIVSIIIAM